MKRHIILLFALLCTVAAIGQSDLNVAPLFDFKIKRNTAFTASHLEGRHLKPYSLTLFKSITTSDHRLYDEIDSLVTLDGKSTIDKECGYIDGKLYYAFYMFPPKGNTKKYRYLFYRNSSLRKEMPNEATVVYIEGYVTLTELKNMFKYNTSVNFLPINLN